MSVGSKNVAKHIARAQLVGSRIRDFAAKIEAILLAELAPYFEAGKPQPDIKHLLESISRSFSGLGDSLSDRDFARQEQSSVSRFQKDEERLAAQRVRTLLRDVRYMLDRNLGKEKASLHFEGRSSLVRMSYPVLERVGGKLVGLLRAETIDWQKFPAEDHIPSRDVLANKLEVALAQLRSTLEAGLSQASALSDRTSNWKREINEKRQRLQRRIRLVQGFLAEAGLDFEASELQLKKRKTPMLPEGGKPGAGKEKPGGKDGASTPTPAAPAPGASAPTPAPTPTPTPAPTAPDMSRGNGPNDGKALVPAVTTAS